VSLDDEAEGAWTAEKKDERLEGFAFALPPGR
jgi:hypothetical protein